MKMLTLCSGGLDSVTLAYSLASSGSMEVGLVTFDYGQRHVRETQCAERAAHALGAQLFNVDLRAVGAMMGGSSLTDDLDVPEGHYAEDTMRATVVPNRNMIMLAIAGGLAVANGYDMVATAVHAGDHFVYPDCRPEFIAAAGRALELATDGFGDIGLHAPFVTISKARIVSIGHTVGVPFADTWSCYVGKDRHCGRCGTCVERAEAFDLAGVDDPTDYADPTFWREAVAAAAEG